jgi:quinol monooxygenase YgiN
MIVIAGTIDIDPARRADAEAAIRPLVEATRAEEGCVRYGFAGDLEDPGRLHLFERWASEEALHAHFASPHMAAFQAAMAGFGVRGMDVERYGVESVGPVFG